ncbi:MAG: glycosyltransferase [Janthinobacterium lividum]
MLVDDRGPRTSDHARPSKAGSDQARSSGLRRLFGLPERRTADLPPELAFLVAQGVSPLFLHSAARIAATTGVTGEAALFGLGFSDERYHRLLARHLGVPYLDAPLPLARGLVDPVSNRAAGWAPLAPSPARTGHVLAARGEALRNLLDDHRIEPGPYDFALTTRRRFEALLRHHDEAGLCARAATGIAEWDPALSARGGAAAWQRRSAFGIAAALALTLPCAADLAWSIFALSLFVVFAAAVVQRLIVVAAGPTISASRSVLRMPDRDLPIYTIVVPLFREARVLAQLVRALDALDYPAAKLDIKMMLESCDADTIAAVTRMNLPPRYEVIILADGHPRVKPRALNAALEAAAGELLVVYDAEDRPDPGQLRAAVARFADAPADLICLQARLTVDHADEAWITRMFALDYGALFHAVKPGLSALHLPLPLGGTSNHFRVTALRRVCGWDAWNVTEDIDLGYRLARFGLRVGSLDSDTYEEAPLTLARWMPQRSRWLKGWMVTAIVHGRQPRRLFRELGWRSGLSVVVSLASTILGCLVGPPLLVVVVVEAFSRTLFRPDTPLWWLSVAAAGALLVGGAVSAVWPALLALRRMGRLDLAPGC